MGGVAVEPNSAPVRDERSLGIAMMTEAMVPIP